MVNKSWPFDIIGYHNLTTKLGDAFFVIIELR